MIARFEGPPKKPIASDEVIPLSRSELLESARTKLEGVDTLLDEQEKELQILESLIDQHTSLSLAEETLRLEKITTAIAKVRSAATKSAERLSEVLAPLAESQDMTSPLEKDVERMADEAVARYEDLNARLAEKSKHFLEEEG